MCERERWLTAGLEQLHRALETVRGQYDDNATFRAFYLVAVEGGAVDEVAKRLGLSADSVYKARARCTAKVRLALAALREAEG